MQFYWYILLAVVFFNVLFSLVSVTAYARSIVRGINDIYSLVFACLFILFLGFVFMYALEHADKSL